MKYFKLSEFDCNCGCGLNNMDKEFLGRLDKARELAGVPFEVNSGSRCETHNKNVGGVDTSSHLIGLATDLKAVSSSRKYKIVTALMAVGFNRIGVGKDFIHVDKDPFKNSKRIWTY